MGGAIASKFVTKMFVKHIYMFVKHIWQHLLHIRICDRVHGVIAELTSCVAWLLWFHSGINRTSNISHILPWQHGKYPTIESNSPQQQSFQLKMCPLCCKNIVKNQFLANKVGSLTFNFSPSKPPFRPTPLSSLPPSTYHYPLIRVLSVAVSL